MSASALPRREFLRALGRWLAGVVAAFGTAILLPRTRPAACSAGPACAGCPELPGCASCGQTEAEAMENIKEAIALYLEPSEENRCP